MHIKCSWRHLCLLRNASSVSEIVKIELFAVRRRRQQINSDGYRRVKNAFVLRQLNPVNCPMTVGSGFKPFFRRQMGGVQAEIEKKEEIFAYCFLVLDGKVHRAIRWRRSTSPRRPTECTSCRFLLRNASYCSPASMFWGGKVSYRDAERWKSALKWLQENTTAENNLALRQFRSGKHLKTHQGKTFLNEHPLLIRPSAATNMFCCSVFPPTLRGMRMWIYVIVTKLAKASATCKKRFYYEVSEKPFPSPLWLYVLCSWSQFEWQRAPNLTTFLIKIVWGFTFYLAGKLLSRNFSIYQN